MQQPRISKEDGLILLTVLIWGINFPILKQALEAMHPFVLNVFRFIVSVFGLWVMMAIQRKSWKLFYWSEMKPYLGRVVLLGLLGYFFYQVAFIMGIARTTAGNSALIMASTPIWTAMIGMLFGFEKLGKVAWIGLIISMAGTFLVAL
ncbi:MAG: DMT family transporter, partial [Bacteroidota bacterium]